MKNRYFLLPLVIISLMVLVLDRNKNIVNKEVVSNNLEVSYPFFGNERVDGYIEDYLNGYMRSDNDVLIDYDYYNKDSKYYLTFYNYLFDGNKLDSSEDTFVIDMKSSIVSKGKKEDYDYDFAINKKVDKNRKIVALTFDDGPNYNTNKVIDILNKYNVKATFFVLGSKIKGNEDILKKMKDSGMEIGNHTYNHLLLTKYKDDKIKKEINDTSELIFKVTGKKPSLLRPSYGSFNSRIKKQAGAPIIIWDIDTLDWKYHNSKRIASRVLNKVKDGDIVLMHDIYSATANALNIIVPELINRGYDIVTVPELFYYKGISLENGKVYGFAR